MGSISWAKTEVDRSSQVNQGLTGGRVQNGGAEKQSR